MKLLRYKEFRNPGIGHYSDQHQQHQQFASVANEDGIHQLIVVLSNVDDRTSNKYTKEATQNCKGAINYAWILQKLEAERERGSTVVITLWKFEAGSYNVSIIDDPKNLITSISQSECPEAGMPMIGQPCDHTHVTFSLGANKPPLSKDWINCGNAVSRCLMEALDTIHPPSSNTGNAVCIPIQNVYKIDSIGRA